VTALRGCDPEESPCLYGRVLRILCRKTGAEQPSSGKWKGQKFFHDFADDVELHGLPAGAVILMPSGDRVTLEARCSVLISRKGNDLWTLS
jgi:hypothetical protein